MGIFFPSKSAQMIYFDKIAAEHYHQFIVSLATSKLYCKCPHETHCSFNEKEILLFLPLPRFVNNILISHHSLKYVSKNLILFSCLSCSFLVEHNQNIPPRLQVETYKVPLFTADKLGQSG